VQNQVTEGRKKVGGTRRSSARSVERGAREKSTTLQRLLVTEIALNRNTIPLLTSVIKNFDTSVWLPRDLSGETYLFVKLTLLNNSTPCVDAHFRVNLIVSTDISYFETTLLKLTLLIVF